MITPSNVNMEDRFYNLLVEHRKRNKCKHQTDWELIQSVHNLKIVRTRCSQYREIVCATICNRQMNQRNA